MNRFRGALALLAICALLGLGLWLTRTPPGVEVELTPAVFRFEKEDLVGVKVVRPDGSGIELVEQEGKWRVVGEPWRPSRAMVRRIGHQLHDLTARAVVAEGVTDPETYGLGAAAIRVALTLRDGQKIEFEAGDPNPSSVSWYLRPLPGDTVYVVKKSAIDYYRLSIEEFRERKFAQLDADAATAITYVGPEGAERRFEREPPPPVGDEPKGGAWRMTTPVAWAANREEIRSMLGRSGALKADVFVEDGPQDLAAFGLDKPRAKVTIALRGADPVTLVVGAIAPTPSEHVGDTHERRYVLRAEDDAIYVARVGFLEAFEAPIETYRRRDVVGRHAWDVRRYVVTRGGVAIAVEKSSDGWRWPDGGPIPGSTPERVASTAAELQALAFHDADVAASGLAAPSFEIALSFADGARTITVGSAFEGPPEPAPAIPAGMGLAPPKPRSGTRYYARLDGDPVTYEVDDRLAETVDDLFREYARKGERDAEKRIDDKAGEQAP